MSLEVIKVRKKLLEIIIKRLVTLLYIREPFLVWSWGLDEHTDLYIISEESYPDRHRFGVHEEVYQK